MTTTPVTIDQIGYLVRTLALTTKSDARPHEASNLVQPSLIQQLRASIVPSSGSTSSGSKLPNERINLDPGALILFNRLRSGIATLHAGTGRAKSYGAPEELLIDWYIALAIDEASGDVDQTQLDNLYGRLDEWRTEIMDQFNPPERGEIRDAKTREPYACPECGWAEVTKTVDGHDVVCAALVGIERPWRGEEGVKCRRCLTTWIGRADMTELAADLGIKLDILATPEPPAPEPAPTPYWLCAMTEPMARAFARTRSIPLTQILIAERGPTDRIRKAAAPILFAQAESYAPGPHAKARVDDAFRVARLINTANGYTASGHPTD
jgi:hypothetical protein